LFLNLRLFYFAPSPRCCLELLLKFIWRKTIIISNRSYEFFKFEYAASYYDIQINLKTPKHLILAFNFTEIGTSLLMAQNLSYRHFCKRVFLMSSNKNKIYDMQCCSKQPNRWFKINKTSLQISEQSGIQDPHFNGFSWFSNNIYSKYWRSADNLSKQ
jgi:hypothetical protein